MPSDINGRLGRQLRRRRRLVGLTQQQLADAVGVRPQQIQKYEYGVNRVSAVMLWRLACVLDAPIEYFFEGLSRAEARRAAG
jgi:transcriptional regulator with XRE-family HTH domain